MADTHRWNVCVRTGDPQSPGKGKFSKQMKKKKLSLQNYKD